MLDEHSDGVYGSCTYEGVYILSRVNQHRLNKLISVKWNKERWDVIKDQNSAYTHARVAEVMIETIVIKIKVQPNRIKK